MPVPNDEAARRLALLADHIEQATFPPLYQLSTMHPDDVQRGVFGLSSPVRTSYIFAEGDGTAERPRVVIHTIERGTVDEAAPVLWRRDLGTPVPEFSGGADSFSAMVSGSTARATRKAVTNDGWMVALEAPDATLIVIGNGVLPSALPLKCVDVEALKRSELRSSGIKGSS